MEPPRTLAIVATRGASNHLFQVATLVRAATTLEWPVRVLFKDAAALKLRRDRIDRDEWSPAYRQIQPGLTERLAAAEFSQLSAFLRDAKEHGDDVRFWVCEETLTGGQMRLDELVSSIDGVVSEADFRKIAAEAHALLVF